MKSINVTAVEMIKDLAQKIRDTDDLAMDVRIELTRQKGVNPIQLLEEKGVLEEIINNCVDIQNLADQLHDFNPKFQ